MLTANTLAFRTVAILQVFNFFFGSRKIFVSLIICRTKHLAKFIFVSWSDHKNILTKKVPDYGIYTTHIQSTHMHHDVSAIKTSDLLSRFDILIADLKAILHVPNFTRSLK